MSPLGLKSRVGHLICILEAKVMYVSCLLTCGTFTSNSLCFIQLRKKNLRQKQKNLRPERRRVRRLSWSLSPSLSVPFVWHCTIDYWSFWWSNGAIPSYSLSVLLPCTQPPWRKINSLIYKVFSLYVTKDTGYKLVEWVGITRGDFCLI